MLWGWQMNFEACWKRPSQPGAHRTGWKMWMPPPVRAQEMLETQPNPSIKTSIKIRIYQQFNGSWRKLAFKVPKCLEFKRSDARRMAVQHQCRTSLSWVFWFQWNIRPYFSSECCGVLRFLHHTAACRSYSFTTPRNCLSPLASSMSFWQLLASWNLAMKHWRSWSFAYQDLKWKATMKTGPMENEELAR